MARVNVKERDNVRENDMMGVWIWVTARRIITRAAAARSVSS